MYYENRWMIGDSAPTTTTTTTQSTWTRFEDKLFEQALVIFPEEIADRWQRIADRVPGKLAEEVRQHYEALVHDVFEIDSGRVELPCYSDDSFLPPSWEAESPPSQISFGSPKPKHADAERKKGVPWTPDEHRLFLIGLDKYGKGDWRSISRNVVVTRTPTQVASHAQKYFIRQNSMKKERKRSSIHDITTVDGNAVVQPIDQSWIASSSDGQGEQPPVLQALTLPSAFTNQGGSLGYQNFNFPM